jgi:uncharacterized protein YndB with AHSA1/START domain
MDYINRIQGTKKFPPILEIKHSTTIHADPSSIYRTLTTSEGLDSWFTNGSGVNTVPGEDIRFQREN